MVTDLVNFTVGKYPAVDGRKIGRGSYDLLNDGDKAVVAFGMTPFGIMEEIEKGIRARLGEIYANHFGMPERADAFAKAFKCTWVSWMQQRMRVR